MRVDMESEKENFVRRIMAASPAMPDTSREIANYLWDLGPESNRLATAECNRPMTETEKARDAELDRFVAGFSARLGLKCYRQGDPRGNTIRVVVGPQYADNWDGETVGCG